MLSELRKRGDGRMFVKADRRLPFGPVKDVLLAGESAGYADVLLMAEVEDGDGLDGSAE